MTKIATRNLILDMYIDDHRRLHAHGRLVDDRSIPFKAFEGGITPPGCFHDLEARMIIDLKNFEILDINVDFHRFPDAACPAVATVYEQLKGVRVASGYTKKVLSLAGGTRGCAHLTHLIVVMGPAIVQGAFTALAAEDTDLSGVPGFSQAQMEDYFHGSCHVWKK
jgi:hypothetical protein